MRWSIASARRKAVGREPAPRGQTSPIPHPIGRKEGTGRTVAPRLAKSVQIKSVMILDAVMHLHEDIALDPGEACVGIRAVNLALDNKAVAEYHANVFDRSARVILLGHAIDGDFPPFLAIDHMDDEDFLMPMYAVIVNPEGFPAILKFTYHVTRRIF